MNITAEIMLKAVMMKDLSSSEQLVYLLLNCFSDLNGITKIEKETLADITGLSESTISDAVDTLESCGIITHGFEMDKNVPGGIIRTFEIIK